MHLSPVSACTGIGDFGWNCGKQYCLNVSLQPQILIFLIWNFFHVKVLIVRNTFHISNVFIIFLEKILEQFEISAKTHFFFVFFCFLRVNKQFFNLAWISNRIWKIPLSTWFFFKIFSPDVYGIMVLFNVYYQAQRVLQTYRIPS